MVSGLSRDRMDVPHVFSNARAVRMLSTKTTSDEGLCFRPASEQSLRVPGYASASEPHVPICEILTEGWNNDDLGALRYELSERFRESHIPADEQANLAQGCIDYGMWLSRAARNVCTLRGAPEILLDVGAQDLALVVDKVCNVLVVVIRRVAVQCSDSLLPGRRVFRYMRSHLDNSAGHDADLELAGEILVVLEVLLRVRAHLKELWVFRQPVRQVVFGENDEVASLLCRGSYEVLGFGVVLRRLHGL